MIAQIAYDTIRRRAASWNNLGALEYFSPRISPTLEHRQSNNLQFGENDPLPNFFLNRKDDTLRTLNLWKPYVSLVVRTWKTHAGQLARVPKFS